MAHWLKILSQEEAEKSDRHEIVVEGEIIAVFRQEGSYYALDGLCPHHQGPLAQGEVDGLVVECPWHGWKFHLDSGCYAHNQSMQHTTYPIKLEGGFLWIQKNPKED
ncbi:MAG: Rieske (2Fe-2S) protein [Pirellulaceae bacterium]|nr:Rieske (2Fe-2S) protein [Pirellulaceae bacterium]